MDKSEITEKDGKYSFTISSKNIHNIRMIWKMLAVLALFCVLLPNIYGLERSDIDDIKQNATDSRKKLDDLEKKISEQKITIQNNEKTIDEKKDFVRELKREQSDSWDWVELVNAAEQEVTDAEKFWREAKDKLVELLNEKSQLILSIKLLDSDLIKVERELRQQSYRDFNETSIRKLIGIELSKSCVTMIQNHIPNECPTYDILKQLDTSILTVSGGWITKDNMTQRGVPPLINSWRAYDHDSTPRIIVNPPPGMTERIAMIVIMPNFDVYTTAQDMKMSNNTRMWHENRYIDILSFQYLVSFIGSSVTG